MKQIDCITLFGKLSTVSLIMNSISTSLLALLCYVAVLCSIAIMLKNKNCAQSVYTSLHLYIAHYFRKTVLLECIYEWYQNNTVCVKNF